MPIVAGGVTGSRVQVFGSMEDGGTVSARWFAYLATGHLNPVSIREEKVLLVTPCPSWAVEGVGSVSAIAVRIRF
jgi:hypothetical protein